MTTTVAEQRKGGVLTLHDVLAEAMECAVADRMADELVEVRIGKFTDPGAGWYWIAVFKHEAGSHPSVAKPVIQPLRNRVLLVMSAWEEAYTRSAGKAED